MTNSDGAYRIPSLELGSYAIQIANVNSQRDAAEHQHHHKGRKHGHVPSTMGLVATVLEKGGSEDAMALFVAFRGREPRVDALLKQEGIAA